MVPCAASPQIARMSEKLMTFEEFRLSHDDALRAQRETLHDDAVAQNVLRTASTAKGWSEWPNALAVES